MRKFLTAALAFFATSIALADVRYEYIGQPVGTNALPIFSATDTVTSYFVLPGFPTTGDFHASDFVDFETKIANLELTKSTGADAGAHLVFSPTGALTSWSFVVGNYSPPSSDPSLVEVWSNSSDLAPSGDRITVYYQGGDKLGATAKAGQWNQITGSIPEPSSSILILLGISAIIPLARKARR